MIPLLGSTPSALLTQNLSHSDPIVLPPEFRVLHTQTARMVTSHPCESVTGSLL